MYAIIQNNAVTQVGDLFTLSSGVFIRPTGSAYESWALTNNVLEIIEGEQKDQRFYWVAFDSYTVGATFVTRNYTNTPKALEDITETPQGQTEPVTTQGLKSQWIAQGKVTANSQLAATDWMVIRKLERNVDIPADVVAERAKIIADCTAKEAAITAATTMEAFLAVVSPVNTVTFE
jgi:hypothetical protein